MTAATELAEFLVGTKAGDLPEKTTDYAAMMIASTLASAAYGTALLSSKVNQWTLLVGSLPMDPYLKWSMSLANEGVPLLVKRQYATPPTMIVARPMRKISNRMIATSSRFQERRSTSC